jgi:hypothetical protein
MATVRCRNRHFYDDHQRSDCPFCGVGMELEGTLKQTEKIPGLTTGGSGQGRAAGDFPTLARGGRVPPRPGADPGVTRHIWAAKVGFDPVVGWLVCIEGPEKGRDYRIHTERNFIGRSPHMDIAITGDDAISRENHAVVSFNPKNGVFRLAPGDSRGLIYLNEEEVLTPVELKAYDTIEMGASKLTFVPFCGERFQWEKG